MIWGVEIIQSVAYDNYDDFEHVNFIMAKEEELWKLKYSTMQKYNLQKILSKEIKILQDIITLQLNLKFEHKPKYHLSKILI